MNPQDRPTQRPALSLILPLLSFLVLMPSLALGQHFTFQAYEQEQGLRNHDVFKLIQDNDGLLWSATENGLFRYDGSEFRRFGASDGLEESLLIDLHEDASGRIWTASNDHLYFRSGSRFYAVQTPSTIQLAPGQRLASIDPSHILFVDRNTLMLAEPASPQRWAAAPYFTSAQISQHPEAAQIHSAFVDRDGSLWLGCAHQLCHVKKGQIEVLGQAQGLPNEPWLFVLRDRSGQLWVRDGHHIRVLTPGAAAFVPRDISPETIGAFSGSGIITMGEDRNGGVLTQTGTGIARWEGDHWQLFDRSNGIDFSDISTILTDRHGSLWFSTRGHGLRRWLGYGEIENWTTSQGLGNEIVWSIFRDRENHLWIGDDLHIGQLDQNQKRILPVPFLGSSTFPSPVGITESTGGAIWLANIAGHLLHSSPATGKLAAEAKLPPIARIFSDSAHRIWIMSRDGLYVLRDPDANANPEKIDDPRLSNDSFADGAEGPDGSLWFISDHHLYRLSSASDPAQTQWAEISLDKQLIQGQMRGIAVAADGTLWIGGGLPGLLHLKVVGDRAQLLTLFAAPQIVSTDVQFVRLGPDGWLWIGTDLGLSIYDGTSWKLLTQRDGLVSNDIDEGAFYADPDGSVWIGANGGAIHLLHPASIFSPEALTATLRSASLGDLPLNLNLQRNTWRWRRAPLDIAFTSFNYERHGSIHFLYRLVGLESGWTQTADHRVHYPAVPPGNYRFEVQAIDPAQQKQSAIASFDLSIRPPWWQTQAFYLFLAVLSFTCSILVWLWRERRLTKRQQMLEQLVAQRTSELEAEKAELMAAREALHHQATHDALTGVWNRSAILDILSQEIAQAQRQRSHLAVVLADIDYFKMVNDSLGHLAGDVILRDAAHRMAHSIRPSDFIGRYGGEEFLIVLPGLAPEAPSSRLIQLQQGISEVPFSYLTESIPVTSSFGVAWLDDDTSDVEDLISRADEALYTAKASGRNRVVFYSEPEQPDAILDRP